jgi:hypothetical protein
MSQAYIKVIAGQYRGEELNNVVFPLVKQYTRHGDKDAFITVDGSHLYGGDKSKIRVKVNSINDVEISDVAHFLAQDTTPAVIHSEAKSNTEESDEVIMERIGVRFDILHEMTRAACEGNIKAMIVTGPPGVGKSFGVEKELERAALFDQIGGRPLKTEVVKGAVTPIGLYQILYKRSDANNVLVFDDSDDVFNDELSLNMLKAALDSGKSRKICWNSESSALRREGIPESFLFKGSIIFITNKNFDNVKSKKLQDHLAALESRCHFLDLALNTPREKLLRIRQIANTGELFNDYDLNEEQQADIISFLFANQHKLREISLRTALKMADLFKSFPAKWQAMSQELVMKKTAA